MGKAKQYWTIVVDSGIRHSLLCVLQRGESDLLAGRPSFHGLEVGGGIGGIGARKGGRLERHRPVVGRGLGRGDRGHAVRVVGSRFTLQRGRGGILAHSTDV